MQISKALLIARYKDQIDNAVHKLTKHAVKLAATPADAMRWADATYTAAAEHSIASALLATLTGEYALKTPPTKVLTHMQNFLLESILTGTRHSSRSTSVSSNMIEQEVLAAKSREYEILSKFTELVD